MNNKEKNKIYFGSIAQVPEVGGVYISAKNIKEAKMIAFYSELVYEGETEFIDVRVRLLGGRKNIHYTDIKSGELTIEQIVKEKVAWWECENRCDQDFKFIGIEKYECNKCGFVGYIPYEDD